MTHNNIHTCSYSCERPPCIRAQRDELAQRLFELVAEAVAAEREACAKVCEQQMKSYMSKQYTTDPLGGFRERFAAEQCADAIRARSKQEQPR